MRCLCLLFVFLFASLDLLAAPFIKEVQVQGVSGRSKKFVFQRIKARKGSSYRPSVVKKDVKRLFETGIFKEVHASLKTPSPNEIILIYKVKEKATVEKISFRGNFHLEEKELLEVLKVEKHQLLNLSQVKESVFEIKKLYEEKGYYLVQVTSDIKRLGNKRSHLVFRIKEGSKVFLRRVHLIGNKKIPTSELKSIMMLKTANFLSLFTGTGSYRKELLQRDIQVLNYYYFSRGYVQAQVGPVETVLSPDKKGVEISVYIKEGEIFKTGQVLFGEQKFFSNEELQKTVRTKQGKTFSSEVLQRDLKRLQRKFGEMGYAYANIIPRTRVLEEDRLVHVFFEMQLGEKVRVGKIRIRNNLRTRDKVIRRELRVYEGELYNEKLKDTSLARIKRLGFFENVEFHPQANESDFGIMDMDIVVKERSTGSIHLSAGYSQYYGLGLGGRLEQLNFLGKGQKLGVYLDINRKQSLFDIHFNEPYLFDTKWEVGFDLYRRKRILFDYEEKKNGGQMRLGYPIFGDNDLWKTSVSYTLEDAEVSLDSYGDPEIFPVETVNGLRSVVRFRIGYDDLDDRYLPSKGTLANLSLEHAGLLGDIEYSKVEFLYRYYRPFFDKKIIWRNNLVFGKAFSSGGKRIPFNELYLIGGVYSLRGFPTFGVGERKFSLKTKERLIKQGLPEADAERLAYAPYGGEQQLYYNMEFLTPLIKEMGVFGLAFYDVGNAMDQFSLDDFHHSAGVGLRWFSPVGVLRFECGKVLKTKSNFFDKKSFQCEFAIGSSF